MAMHALESDLFLPGQCRCRHRQNHRFRREYGAKATIVAFPPHQRFLLPYSLTPQM